MKNNNKLLWIILDGNIPKQINTSKTICIIPKLIKYIKMYNYIIKES